MVRTKSESENLNAEYESAVEAGLEGKITLTRPTLLQTVARSGLWNPVGASLSRMTKIKVFTLETKDEYALCSSLNLPFRRLVFDRLRKALFEVLNIDAIEAAYKKSQSGDRAATRNFLVPIAEWDQQQAQEFLKSVGADTKLSVDGADLLEANSPEDFQELGLASKMSQQRFKYQLALYAIRQQKLSGCNSSPGRSTNRASGCGAWVVDNDLGLRAIKPVRTWTTEEVVELCSALGLPQITLSRVQDFALAGEDFLGLSPDLVREELLVSDLEDRQALLAAIKLLSGKERLSLGRCEYFDISYECQDESGYSKSASPVYCLYKEGRHCIAFHQKALFGKILDKVAKQAGVNVRLWYRILELTVSDKGQNRRRLGQVEANERFGIFSRNLSFSSAFSQLACEGEKLLRWDPLHTMAQTTTRIVNGWNLACSYTASENDRPNLFKSVPVPIYFRQTCSKKCYFRLCFMVDFTRSDNPGCRIGNNLFFLSKAFVVRNRRKSSKITKGPSPSFAPKLSKPKTQPSTLPQTNWRPSDDIVELPFPGSHICTKQPAEATDSKLDRSGVTRGSCIPTGRPVESKLEEKVSVAYHLGRLGVSEDEFNGVAREAKTTLLKMTAGIKQRGGYSSASASTSDDSDETSDSDSDSRDSTESNESQSVAAGSAEALLVQSWASRVHHSWKPCSSDQPPCTYPLRPGHRGLSIAPHHEAKAVQELIQQVEAEGMARFFEILSTHDLTFSGAVPVVRFFEAGLELGVDQSMWTLHAAISFWGRGPVYYELALLNLEWGQKQDDKIGRQLLDRLRCRGHFKGINMDEWLLETSSEGTVVVGKPKWSDYLKRVDLYLPEELLTLLSTTSLMRTAAEPLLESYQDLLEGLRRQLPKGGQRIQDLCRKLEERDSERTGKLHSSTFFSVINYALSVEGERGAVLPRLLLNDESLLSIALHFGCLCCGDSSDSGLGGKAAKGILYAAFVGKVLGDASCQKQLYLNRLIRLDIVRCFAHVDPEGTGCVNAHSALMPHLRKAELDFLGLSSKCQYAFWCAEEVIERFKATELQRMERERIQRFVRVGGPARGLWNSPVEFIEQVLKRLSTDDENGSGFVHRSRFIEALKPLVPNLCSRLIFLQDDKDNLVKVNYESFLLDLCKGEDLELGQKSIICRLFCQVLEKEKLSLSALLERLETIERDELLPRRTNTSELLAAFPRSRHILARVLRLLDLHNQEHVSFDELLYSCISRSKDARYADLESKVAQSKLRSCVKCLEAREVDILSLFQREDKNMTGRVGVEAFAFLFQTEGVQWSLGEVSTLNCILNEGRNSSVDYECLLLGCGVSAEQKRRIGSSILKRNSVLTFDSQKQSLSALGLRPTEERKMRTVVKDCSFRWRSLQGCSSFQADKSLFELFRQADGDLDGWISFRAFLVAVSQEHRFRAGGLEEVRKLGLENSVSTGRETVVRYEYICEDLCVISRRESMKDRLVKKHCFRTGETSADLYLRTFGTTAPPQPQLLAWMKREEALEMSHFIHSLQQRAL